MTREPAKSRPKGSKPDANLLKALTKAYAARAKLFHNGILASSIDLLVTEIDCIRDKDMKWSLPDLGITSSAFERVRRSGGLPHQVFAHPHILAGHPHLIAYYRNIATISKKGIAQILFPTAKYEERRSGEMPETEAAQLCRTLNSIVSAVIDGIPRYKVEISRKAILAEIGSQLQGSWANMVGQGAAKAVADVIAKYVVSNRLGKKSDAGGIELVNGWSIVFGAEPDVAFFDRKGVKQIAIEIKGSLDVAGAQSRYGETKKSFAKQIAENPRCHTVYLASCFTDAVIKQIKLDQQVRDWFNLTSILYDEDERRAFLDQLFHVVRTPAR